MGRLCCRWGGGYAAGGKVAMLPVETRLCCWRRRGYVAGGWWIVVGHNEAAMLPVGTRLCCWWGGGYAAGGDAAMLPVGGGKWVCINDNV
jgi:hypothetical protein